MAANFRDPALWATIGQTLNQMAWAPVSQSADPSAPMLAYQQKQQEAQQKNTSMEWLRVNDQEAYQYALAGAPVTDALKFAMERKQQAAAPRKYEYKTLNDGSLVAIDPYDPNGVKTVVKGQPDPLKGLPAGAQEWQWLQSQPPEVQEQYKQYQQAKKGKDGLRITYDEQGRPIVEQGNVADLKEWQSKDRFWTERLVNAEKTLQQHEGALTNMKDSVAANAGTVGNYLKSTEYQQAEQAMRDFLAPILRKDTGAAVTQGELDLYRPLYFPMPGDSEQVIEQKRRSRSVILQSLGNTTGVDTSGVQQPGAVQDYTDYFKP